MSRGRGRRSRRRLRLGRGRRRRLRRRRRGPGLPRIASSPQSHRTRLPGQTGPSRAEDRRTGTARRRARFRAREAAAARAPAPGRRRRRRSRRARHGDASAGGFDCRRGRAHLRGRRGRRRHRRRRRRPRRRGRRRRDGGTVLAFPARSTWIRPVASRRRAAQAAPPAAAAAAAIASISRGPSDSDVSIGASNNRTAPDGTLAAFGGASAVRPTGGDGRLSSRVLPGTRARCATDASRGRTNPSEASARVFRARHPAPRRVRRPPGPAGPSRLVSVASRRARLRPSDCATQFEAAVAAVGGPASAAALVATSAVVVASAAAATAQQERRQTRRDRGFASATVRPAAVSSAGGEYANHADDATAPFLHSLADADADADDDGVDDDARRRRVVCAPRVFLANGGDP